MSGGIVLQLPRTDGTHHQIHAVGIYHGDHVDGDVLCKLLCIFPEDFAPLGDGLGKFLSKFQKDQRCDPLVGMMGGGVKDLSGSAADHKGADPAPEYRGGQHLRAEERICAYKRKDHILTALGGKRNIRFYNCHKNTSGYSMPKIPGGAVYQFTNLNLSSCFISCVGEGLDPPEI